VDRSDPPTDVRAAVCPNCGSDGVDRFCPRCGQEDTRRHPRLGDWLESVRDEYWVLDGKIPRTLGALFLRPGYLTSEWISGRRGRYVRPFRLFLIALPILALGSFNWRTEALLLLVSVPALTIASYGVMERARPRPSAVPHLVASLHVHTVLLGLLLVWIGALQFLSLPALEVFFFPSFALTEVAFLAGSDRLLSRSGPFAAVQRACLALVAHVVIGALLAAPVLAAAILAQRT